MVLYNFKGIQTIPNGKAFIDIMMSKTQRKTPTEIHKHYALHRIRRFYMRKVKFTQQNFHDRLSQILSDFPLLSDIHPFYSDLINVLYDRDHYKLALGQLNNARHLIDNVATDFLRLLKYGDSLYRCQSLKKAALGRMCTVIRKLSASLAYLEQVRQHLVRLPSIDPTTRTLIVCGYPNVGKSSFINTITRAHVDVQPYAFTTKSLYVGHTEYKYPSSILDHPLEDRNTVEMLAITALAHLQAAILFLIDISETCGYTIEQQVQLFNSIKPLFLGKPLFILTNKIDMVRPEAVCPEAWKLINDLADPSTGGTENIKILPMSTLTAEGVENVKEIACEKLLQFRVERKLKSKASEKVINRIHVAMPTARDTKDRPPFIPTSVLEERMPDVAETKKERALREMIQSYQTEKREDSMWARGEVPNMNSKLWRERWQLANPDWKFDIIPEIIDGKTIFDFIDPDIEKMLDDLEREEKERVHAVQEEEDMMSSESEIDEETMGIIKKIRQKKQVLKIQNKTGIDMKDEDNVAENRSRSTQRRTFGQLESHLTEMGLSEEQVSQAVGNVRERSRSRSRSASRVARKRSRSASASKPRDEENGMPDKKILKRAKSRTRSVSLTPKPGAGYKNVQNLAQAARIQRKLLVSRGKLAKKGEADRSIPDLKPRHLNSGKRGLGKNQRR